MTPNLTASGGAEDRESATAPTSFTTTHPAADLKGLVAWAKQNPDKTNYATASPAFTLASELFKLRSGEPGEMIPYKSGNEQVMSVVSNQVTFTMSEPPSAVAQVSAGKVRALAVTAPARLPELPDVPTKAST